VGTTMLVVSLLAAACSSGGGSSVSRSSAGAATSAPTPSSPASSGPGAGVPTTTAGPFGASAVAPLASSACGGAGRDLTAGQVKVTMTSGGTSRWYFRHVPPAYDGVHPIPLVVDLHGYEEGAQIHTVMSGLGPFGDQHGFMTVTPQGSGVVANWTTTATSADMVFIGGLLDQVERTACVDERRVFVAGLSNGAMMTSAVACVYSGRVAAVAPVAGVTAITPCPLRRAVPLIAFHGTADPFVSYTGGLGPKALALPAPDGSGKTLAQLGVSGKAAPGSSVPDIMATWAGRDGCATVPAATPVASDVTLLSFTCPAGVAVELYRITGGGHAWPGSAFSASIASVVGRTTMSISANALMWAFFEAHPLTTAPGG